MRDRMTSVSLTGSGAAEGGDMSEKGVVVANEAVLATMFFSSSRDVTDRINSEAYLKGMDGITGRAC